MGVLKIFEKAGKGILKGLDTADKVISHPAVMPLTMFVPWGWARTALTAVRRVNQLADELRKSTGQEMDDETKRAEFANVFRGEFPEASDGDIQALAAMFAKVEKGEVQENKDA
jgi:hypothetical protein